MHMPISVYHMFVSVYHISVSVYHMFISVYHMSVSTYHMFCQYVPHDCQHVPRLPVCSYLVLDVAVTQFQTQHVLKGLAQKLIDVEMRQLVTTGQHCHDEVVDAGHGHLGDAAVTVTCCLGNHEGGINHLTQQTVSHIRDLIIIMNHSYMVLFSERVKLKVQTTSDFLSFQARLNKQIMTIYMHREL